tara:strand:- start:15 stop:797 length:783 start_codon:yes stop_codon:yes gene_type:complete
MAGQVGRPEKNTVEYFSHFVIESKVVKILEHRFGDKGYAGYYRLKELIAGTKMHRPEFNSIHDKYWTLEKTRLTEDEFVEMVELLIEMGEIDRELWEEEKVIWMEDFIQTMKPVYYNRGKPLPTKDGIITTSNNSISTSRNQQEGSIGTKGREETTNHTPLIDLKSFSAEYSTLDVPLSYEKYKSNCEERNKSLSNSGFNLWCKTDMNKGWNQRRDFGSDVDDGFSNRILRKCNCSDDIWVSKELAGGNCKDCGSPFSEP